MSVEKPVPFSSLALFNLRLQVKLGCKAEERRIPQFVRFNIHLRFETPPLGCITDQLIETCCYAQISEWVREVCNDREFHLIERLGWETYTAVKNNIPKNVQLKVETHKENPPIPDLAGGASFIVGDWQ